MGKAVDWQLEITNFLKSSNVRVSIFNPRRDDWDSSWKQEASNPQFNEQVNWELDYLASADIKAFYFDPETQSPVTMLELGLMMAESPAKCVVCCPPGFWRRGNLEITCSGYGVFLLDNMEDFKKAILARLR